MNISQLNSNSIVPNFNGSIKMNRNYSKRFKEAFRNNPEIQKLAQDDYVIIPKLAKKKASKGDIYHPKGERIFQLSIEAQKEYPSFWDKVKYAFGFAPSVKVTKNYHSMSSILNIMAERINADKYAKKLFR